MSGFSILKAEMIDTGLTPMLVISDETSLYLLEFITRKGLSRELSQLKKQGHVIVSGNTAPITSIKQELKSYFEGRVTQFKTPFRTFGSPFQQQVWNALCRIPFGETISYAEQARSLGKETAYRAVANANGANQLAIIIPCHRVIASDGSLGGYGGGLDVKQWLIEHERQHRMR